MCMGFVRKPFCNFPHVLLCKVNKGLIQKTYLLVTMVTVVTCKKSEVIRLLKVYMNLGV